MRNDLSTSRGCAGREGVECGREWTVSASESLNCGQPSPSGWHWRSLDSMAVTWRRVIDRLDAVGSTIDALLRLEGVVTGAPLTDCRSTSASCAAAAAAASIRDAAGTPSAAGVLAAVLRRPQLCCCRRRVTWDGEVASGRAVARAHVGPTAGKEAVPHLRTTCGGRGMSTVQLCGARYRCERVVQRSAVLCWSKLQHVGGLHQWQALHSQVTVWSERRVCVSCKRTPPTSPLVPESPFGRVYCTVLMKTVREYVAEDVLRAALTWAARARTCPALACTNPPLHTSIT